MKTLKILLAAGALAATPGLALAQGCHADRTTMSCAPGTTFDAASGTCVADTIG